MNEQRFAWFQQKMLQIITDKVSLFVFADGIKSLKDDCATIHSHFLLKFYWMFMIFPSVLLEKLIDLRAEAFKTLLLTFHFADISFSKTKFDEIISRI